VCVEGVGLLVEEVVVFDEGDGCGEGEDDVAYEDVSAGSAEPGEGGT
jgi:hypothetical protein